jgi:hypothetical protein
VFEFLLEFYAKRGFPVKMAKVVHPCQQLTVLGVEMDLPAGIIRPSPKTLCYLHQALPRMARYRGRVPRYALESLLGKLIWPLLLNRGALSVLHSVYAQLHQIIITGEARVLWSSVRQELLTAWGLLPALGCKQGGWCGLVIASDATGSDVRGNVGYGVTYTRDLDPEVFVHLTRGPSPDSRYHLLPGLRWKWAISLVRQSNQHVNLQEMLALIMGFMAAVKHGGDPSRSRLLFLCDNSSVVGAVSKGRSASPSLNALLRRWCSLLMARSCVIPYVSHIGTKFNPADRPSRWHQ